MLGMKSRSARESGQADKMLTHYPTSRQSYQTSLGASQEFPTGEASRNAKLRTVELSPPSYYCAGRDNMKTRFSRREPKGGAPECG